MNFMEGLSTLKDYATEQVEKVKNDQYKNPRGKRIIAFLRNTFHFLVMEGKDARKPTVDLIITRIIATTLFRLGIACVVLGYARGWLALVGWLVIVNPWKMIKVVKQKALQSAVAMQLMTEKSVSIKKAKQQIKHTAGKRFTLAMVDMFIKSGSNSQRGGIVGFIINIVLSFVREVRDLVKNFLIPAMIVEQKGLKDSINELKKIRNHIPEALVGVLGFDVTGGAINGLLFPVYFVIVVLGVGISRLLGYFDVGLAFPLGETGIMFNPFVFLFVGYFIALIATVIQGIVQGAKSVYFTGVYLTITRGDQLHDDSKEKLSKLIQSPTKK